MSFRDRLSVTDGVSVALSCGLCNQPATANHKCATTRYLRNPAVVHVRPLTEENSSEPSDLFLVRSDYGEEYTVTRATLKACYEQI